MKENKEVPALIKSRENSAHTELYTEGQSSCWSMIGVWSEHCRSQKLAFMLNMYMKASISGLELSTLPESEDVTK